jgi:site-specific DNA-methyltransferase (adenine-specific)
MAILITLEEPTKPMKDEAKAAGLYHHPRMDKSYGRIQIVTVKEVVEDGKRLDLPLGREVLKAAQSEVEDTQLNLLG